MKLLYICYEAEERFHCSKAGTWFAGNVYIESEVMIGANALYILEFVLEEDRS
jgi:hypothetical protein